MIDVRALAEQVGNFRDWYTDTPPRDKWVWMTYSLSQPWRMVRTCRHGCCVLDPFFGSMLLPNFWREPTEQDIASIEREIADVRARADARRLAPEEGKP